MAKKPRGAELSKLSLATRLKAWLKEHQRVAKDSLHRLVTQPFNSFITVAVIAIALALPSSFYVLLGNAHEIGKQWDSTTQISLYIDRRASDKAIDDLQKTLGLWPEIDRITFISKEQGLADFRKHSGFSDVLAHLSDNPLPAVLEILPQESIDSSQKAKALLDKLQQQPIVESAQLDMEWLERLALMLEIGQRITFALVLLLSLGVLLIIGNTIRLEIENRRDEIIVAKLVGATDAFVRRPFLYTGLWYGLAGGLVASVIVAISLWVLSTPASALAHAYQSDFRLLGISFSDTLSLWMTAALLGYFGAWLSVGKHLDELEPR